MKLRVNGIVEDSIVDGPGLRLAVFVQGCAHGCPGCHNPQTHDPDGGYEVEVDEIVELARKNRLLRGITVTGGEPFDQKDACAELAYKARSLGLDVWTYTGYCFESLLWNSLVNGNRLLLATDVLVDGPYIEPMRSLELKWRGSKNQRLVDVKASLLGEPVLWEEVKS